MKCPSLEQIYDMDLDNLLSLKENIEQNKINFNIIPLDEEDFDLYDNNSPNDKDSILNLITSEIKERESTKELLNFFSDLNFNNTIESKFLEELNSKSNNNILIKDISKNNNQENKPQNINIFNKKEICQNPIKITVQEGMKSFLNRTKVDPTKLQYKVSSNKFIENYWSIDKEKKLRKKNSDLSDISSNLTNFSSKNNMKIKNIKGNRSKVFSEKIVIGAIDFKDLKNEKNKKKRKKKIKKDIDEGKKINTLELRRNYKVADVTQFLKKKTTLKPINISKNENNNFPPKKIFFKSELNSPNIKIFNKNLFDIKKPDEINKENQLNENRNNINNIKEKKDKILEETNNRNNNLIEKFYFSLEKGMFKEIKYDKLNDLILNSKLYTTAKKVDIFNNINMKIINEISFILFGNYKKKNEKLVFNVLIKNKNNYNSIDENIKNSNEERKEKLLDNNCKNMNNKIYQSGQVKIHEIDNNKQRKEDNKTKDLYLDIDKEIIQNKEKKEVETSKETGHIQECEEEEVEEEMEQTDITNGCKKDYLEELISNKKEINPKFRNNEKISHAKYSLNPIKQRKLNLDKTKSKEELASNYKINNIPNKTSINTQYSCKIKNQDRLSSPKNESNNNEFKKYVLSSVKPTKIISHYNYIFNKNTHQRPKSSLIKINSISQHSELISENKEIIDYSDIYSNFAELFSGYYLTNNYSDQNKFNLISTAKELYESFNKLYCYELNQELIHQKDEMYKDIVRAEASVIINRIKHAEEKLLQEKDINTNVEKYCLLKKCLELERKNYAREPEEINDDINNKSKGKKFFRVVLSRPEIYDIVCYTLYKNNKWSELPHGLSLGQCWNLYWSYCPPNIDFSNLFSFQKVNHLINNRIVHRKDLLHKHIMRVRRLNKKCNELFDIMPLTFLLSKEYVNFVEEFHKYKETEDYNIWIVKPVGKSRGKGIFLIDNISDVPLNDTFLVQKYLTNPLLLDEGYKFDMRIYCLVTSVNPLEMFLYKDGFARVSNELYSMDISNIKVHLTNAAIQNRNAKKSKNYEKIYGGSKISLDMLRTKLCRQYNIDFDYLIWPQVKDIIIKVFACCQNDIPYCPSTFEMFGFDVIIDSNFRCWLLEINSSPSLERSNVLDDEIKLPLVNDIIKIIDPIDIDKLALLNVLERIIKIRNNNRNKDVYLYSPKVQLNMDLNNIFKGKIPRKYGEIPKDMGRFEMICPNKETDKIIKMAGGQKFYNNKKEKRK